MYSSDKSISSNNSQSTQPKNNVVDAPVQQQARRRRDAAAAAANSAARTLPSRIEYSRQAGSDVSDFASVDPSITTRGTLGTESIAHDVEAGVALIDKSKLKSWQIASKTQRHNTVTATKLFALARPLVDISPTKNAIIADNFRELTNLLKSDPGVQDVLGARVIGDDLGSFDSVRTLDGQAQRLDSKGKAILIQELEESYTKLTEKLDALDVENREMIEVKGRQLANKSTTSDILKRHLAGGTELHPTLARALIQAAVVGVSVYGVGLGTVAALRSYYEADPSRIPQGVLDAVRKEAAVDLTSEEAETLAIAALAIPTNTYVDGTQISVEENLAIESGVGVFKGLDVVRADNKNEIDARKKKIDEALEKIHSPRGPKTGGERFWDAVDNAWSAQLAANMRAALGAAMFGAVTTQETSSTLKGIEMSKTIGAGLLSAGGSTLADGFRALVYQGDNENVTQILKAGFRTGFRVLAGSAKLGTSFAQSAASQTLGQRDVGQEIVTTGLSVIATGGVIKEGMGAGFAAATKAFLPAPDRVGVALTAALNATTSFYGKLELVKQSFDTWDNDGALLATGRSLAAVQAEIKVGTQRVAAVSATEFSSLEFDVDYTDYNRARTAASYRILEGEDPAPSQTSPVNLDVPFGDDTEPGQVELTEMRYSGPDKDGATFA